MPLFKPVFKLRPSGILSKNKYTNAILKIKKPYREYIATFSNRNFSLFNNFITVILFINNAGKVVKRNIQHRKKIYKSRAVLLRGFGPRQNP